MEFTPEILKKLPAETRPKAFALVDQAQADLGARRQADRRLTELYAELADVEHNRSMQIARNGGKSLSVDGEAYHEERRAGVKTQIERFEKVVPTLDARFEIGAQTIDKCIRLIDGASKIRAVKFPKSPRPVEKIRADLADVLAKRAALLNAPVPRAEYLEKIEETISAEAAIGAASFDGRLRECDPFNLKKVLRSDGAEPNSGIASFLLWLFRDQVFAALAEMVPDDGPDVLVAAERTRLIAKVDTEILALEREEEAAIEAADAEGRRIDRRPEMDPRAILGVEIEV